MLRALLLGFSFAAATAFAEPQNVGDATLPSADPARPVISSGEPTFESIGISQGLTSSTIFALHVDRHGFVWFCGDNGVHRYDGLQVQTFDRDPNRRDSLVSRRNFAMADTSDAIWILSHGGVLQRLDTATGTFTHFPITSSDGRRPSISGRLLADPGDRLWIGTDIGLFRLDPGMSAPVAVSLIAAGDQVINSLALSADKSQLLIGSDEGVFALDLNAPARGARDLTQPGVGPIAVLDIAPWRQLLWLQTNKGLFLHDLDRGTTEPAELPDALTRQPIDALAVSDDGALWFGSLRHDGLTRFDPVNGQVRVYRHRPDDPHSLKSDRVAVLRLDPRGDLWIGLRREGVNRLRVSQLGAERFNAPAGRSNAFCALSELPDDRLLLALCSGGLSILDPRSGKFEDRSADLSRAFPSPAPGNALVADGRGGHWLLTAPFGLVHWQADTARATFYPLRASDGRVIEKSYFSSALLDRRGRLWVATGHGLAVLTEPESGLRLVDVSAKTNELFAHAAYEFADVGDGRLWVGTARGLVRFDPDSQRVEHYLHDVDDPATLSDDTVLAIHVDRTGTTWVGTQAGLNRVVGIANDRLLFRRFGMAEGLPDQSIWSITEDARGKLWVGTSRGIARYEVEHDRFRAFLAADGVPDSSVHKDAMLATRDGSLYVATESGLLRVYPDRLDTAPSLPLMLSGYQLGGTEHVNMRGRGVEALSTSYTQAHVRFQIAAFGDARRVSYRLSGLESDWRDMPPSLTVGYDPLPPGSYHFDVRRMGRDGAWLPAAVSVPVVVSAPPWRSGLAYALYAVVALAALVLLWVVYRRHVNELSWLANYDALTGLPNRSRFSEELAVALGDAHSTPLALLFIDLDRFKNINDSLGHRFGDLVLVAAAKRLGEAMPATARLARLGGDEFTVFLPQLKRESEAAFVAGNLVEAFTTPLRIEGSDVVVTLSVGISLYPVHARDGASLIQYADSAMYYAKESGRNAYQLFSPEMTAQVTRRLALETSLRRALELRELHLVFQPKFELASGRVCGAEVLLRWYSAEHGVVAPIEFIPILEDTGMIEPVGLWLIRQIGAQMRAWHRQGRPRLSLAVNISVHQIIRGDLCSRFAELMTEFEIPPGLLEIEVTESAVMENIDQMDATLRDLSALGLVLSIDDFGTGYSSFAQLSHLPVNKLKIDKSFIDGVGSSEKADTLCAAIIAMAHNLKLGVVAEGVESELQHRRLVAMGCDEAQGYRFSKPLPLGELERFLDAHMAKPDSDLCMVAPETIDGTH